MRQFLLNKDSKISFTTKRGKTKEMTCKALTDIHRFIAKEWKPQYGTFVTVSIDSLTYMHISRQFFFRLLIFAGNK
jgi:hypothetical protein